MGRQQLKIIYDGPLDDVIDHAIESALKQVGFERWASGQSMVEPIQRDIAFEREVFGFEHEQEIEAQQ